MRQPTKAPVVGVAITPLTSADHDDWAPLWRGYLEFYGAHLDEATWRVAFARLTGGSEPMGGFLARAADGAAIGLAHWIEHRSCWTVGNYCYLQDLFVAPGLRGASVGRRLIAAVTQKAIELGCARVHWLTHETNLEAMRLYDRVAERPGFVQYRILIS